MPLFRRKRKPKPEPDGLGFRQKLTLLRLFMVLRRFWYDFVAKYFK